jgi:hypothetical protein
LRTLKLLEQHHQRLSELLKLPFEQPILQGGEDGNEKTTTANEGARADASAKTEPGTNLTAKTPTAGVPALSQQRRYASRDLTSSIASNLASARGIRSKYRGQPLSPSVSNDQAPGNMENLPRRDSSRSKMQNMLDQNQSGKPTWAPPSNVPSREGSRLQEMETPKNTASEEGYSRFYSTFGGLINRLSAPLAFAGLPLIAEESGSEATETAEITPPKGNRRRTPQTVSTDPEWARGFSKATLRGKYKDGTSESFYVVPTSGGTVSYANIMNFAEKEKRRMDSSIHSNNLDALDDDEDDFVDARETPVPLSPSAKRKVGKIRSEKELNNTIEELCLENKSLKDMLDKLSKRLHAFEASAQNSSLALAESMRLMRPGSPMSTGSGHKSSSAAEENMLRKKNQELEEELAAAIKQIELTEKDNRKMQKSLERYREKWDMLKAGAKARRVALGTADHGEDEAGPS